MWPAWLRLLAELALVVEELLLHFREQRWSRNPYPKLFGLEPK